MVGKELIIADMKVDDLPEALAIETASFKTPWSEPLFYNEIFKTTAILRVAKINEHVVGYLCADVIIDEGHILNLAVHQEYRGRGIASRMIKEMIDIMRDRSCGSIFLEVRASNDVALKIYEKFGFGLLGTRKNYYVSPVEDAVVMALRLR
ncbi:MAG: ribosomal-protein-alanine N-acetyltransferase [Nitrospira bacterium HGW-Nitrospira-1]|nr:MAG: ribosomal-protein-alanine N-acetyltransferase [Nitrospira bacterium HGW-Nitrospira-1]